MDKDPFKEYIKQSEPNKRDKGYAWHTAIGLQAVDGLKTSKYLIDTAIKNIEGDISIDEAQELLNTYYEENPKVDTEDRTEEADIEKTKADMEKESIGFNKSGYKERVAIQPLSSFYIISSTISSLANPSEAPSKPIL